MRRAVEVFTLAQKTAFVTGGASGIGAAIAREFVRAGARVIIADRDAVQGPVVAANLAKMDFISGGGTPAEFGAFIATDTQKWKQVVDSIGLEKIE